MNEIILIDLPPENGTIKGCWYNGYPIHKGQSENSLNYATVYANEHNIIPNQKKLKQEFEHFIRAIKKAGFTVHLLPFPEKLNQSNCLHHDAIFVRDSGLSFKDYWIKARFSAIDRQIEADSHAETMQKIFKKEIIHLPKNAFLEFGEVFLLETQKGTFYFGGLSRSSKEGHDFVKSIVNPDYYCLIQSEGYHLDTVFSPVINANNELVACILSKKMIHKESIEAIYNLNIQCIDIDPIDSSGEGESLGNYAVNTLVGPGVMLNSALFQTPRVEEILQEMGIKRFVSPLTYFRYAGGSFHCLTNEMYF
ncbi:MAG: hypothetical protein HOK52_12175 [Candidatus Marinimicrobia bacterium]|jgi:N-dimethylarginine dimethylaminohydrolase|nr:hypothetical protein [Candidatus Neomarinimicrobiota bacterium]MBT3937740.1 hypothetical protein [Candidatus Neomarinimicrobiota bacterium]MBT3962296.1 hypothetical protein [Candidatus Neomarinimicrobiota bacterium]MBT4382549.1 hypothetical protein [Candidatus Neomarinimicrobiota bacterium]MBT4635156.1 hypothetical protein [Candidatus Neomarinimicrobiota bacterium]